MSLRRPLAVSLAALGSVGILVGSAGLALLSRDWRPPAPAAAAVSSRDAPLAPRRPSVESRNPQPRSITLRASDLPPAYRLLREAPAGFNPAGDGGGPASWDAIFVAGDGQVVESLAVVYPTAGSARAAFDGQDVAERTAGGVRQAPSRDLGDRETVWLETGPGGGQTIVRVTWQSLNVVAQVSVLGGTGAVTQERVMALAAVQQDRIAAPAPVTAGDAGPAG